MNRGFLIAALALAAAMTLVHVAAGGRLIARPLLESDLETLPRLTLYLCWHAITIVLAGLALGFADGLFWRKRKETVLLASALAAAFFLLGWACIIGFGLAPLQLPQWIAFGPMALCGWLGARK